MLYGAFVNALYQPVAGRGKRYMRMRKVIINMEYGTRSGLFVARTFTSV